MNRRNNLEYKGHFIYNWFSNFEPFETPMEYDGMVFQTPEAFYQAMKTTDPNLRRHFQDMTAGQTKRAGRNVMLRDNWEDIKIGVMLHALQYKFAEGTECRKKLDETVGEIVEWTNWHDNVWGDCICPKCEDTVGRNLLGKLLMQIRDGEPLDNEFF